MSIVVLKPSSYDGEDQVNKNLYHASPEQCSKSQGLSERLRATPGRETQGYTWEGDPGLQHESYTQSYCVYTTKIHRIWYFI